MVAELDGEGVSAALQYRRRAPALSLPDSFALALGARHDWVLLTGDGALRRLANETDVRCHGVLWLLDQLHDHGGLSVGKLHAGLLKIAQHPRCRLPRSEIQRRLQSYSGE